MPFFQFNMIISRVIIGCLVLISSLTVGCVSQKGETADTMEDQAGVYEEKNAEKGLDSPVFDSGSALQTIISSVEAQSAGARLEVLIHGNMELKGYTTIKQAFPFGVAVYMPDTQIARDLALNFAEDDLIQDIRAGYADKDQTTAKVEILLKQDISYMVEEEGSALRLIFNGKDLSLTRKSDAMSESREAVELEKDSGEVISGRNASLTDISFDTTKTGQSKIYVETSSPVKYDLVPKQENILALNLYNTFIPEYHRRPLSTRYFDSAVEQIFPKQKGPGPKDSTIEIQVREKVPYRVFRKGKLISIFLEPSSVSPPEFTKAVKDGTSSGGKTGFVSEQAAAQATAGVDNAVAGLIESKPVYTGEKIKLDFYETDIKNVFRILRSVSGMNFAIDKDVEGKVTMTLEDPVPWDQVLDLVLKMNSLGKIMEGNVIRIATLETLKNEAQDRQDAIEAAKKAQEQKKSLEPLYTEYIPINYSDAASDIEPHISPILTKERGKLSVDKRTNMIIVTDTRDKINQIQEIIYRLDKVTPQIMIEAKVVEVTKDFTRSLGIGWNLSNASDATTGFVDDFDLSLNSSGVAGDFSFFNLAGSTVTALNAQLDASEEQGEVKIVSSPRILTLDNKKAKIKQGTEYAYLERDDSGGSSVKYKDIDLLLEVTPHVTPDKRISMTVKLTKNDVAGVTTTGAPTLATNEAETELLVNNQDTVVIGGIVKTSQKDDSDGLPFLTGIPILRNLFGTTTKEEDRNELLIFITPSIVQLEQKRNIQRQSSVN